MIHRILRTNGLAGYTISGFGYIRYKVFNKYDMRKSGGIIASISDLSKSKRWCFIMAAWAEFMEGIGEKPP